MKKTILFGAFAIVVASAVNVASAADGVSPKKKRPQTLEQACSPTEIKTMCPGVAAGTQAIGDCGVESIAGVSEQCTKFVKRAISKKNNPNQGAIRPKTIKASKKKASGKDDVAGGIAIPVATESNQ